MGFFEAPGDSGASFFGEDWMGKPERDGFIEGLVKSYRESLKNGTAKLTASDFIRLVSMEQELADRKQVKEIRVSWVQPKETESGS